MSALRTVLGRLALLAGGAITGLLLLEGLLQAAALYTSLTRPHDAQTWLHGGQRIVCLGDSNTFGFFLERPTEEAYPRQVQNLWNARAADSPIEVMNLGVPGMNSSKVRSILPEILRTLRPDIVSVMVGVNDFWISPVPPEEVAGARVSLLDSIWSRSRVARLSHIISRAWEPQAINITLPKVGDDKKPEAILHYGGHDIDLTPPAIGGKRKQWRQDLTANLIEIAAQVAQANARLILLTYPAEGTLYNQANAAIRSAAATTSTMLIDLGSAFLKLCPSRDPKVCDDLFYFDFHPRLKGHQLAAQLIVDGLESEASVFATAGQQVSAP